MDVCLRVLKKTNESRFDSYSVRNSVLNIFHITFRDCRVHIFSDNLSRNSCIYTSSPGLVHFLVSETTSLSKAVNVFYKYNGQVCGTIHGCLPFTWPDRGRFTLRANGKQKFKTGITCSIYQNTAVIKLVSKMTLKKWNTKF